MSNPSPSSSPLLSSSRLRGIRAKIERANQHIKDLEVAKDAFLAQKPYGLRVEDDLKTGEKVHRLEERKQIPACIALIAGDAIHNLRSALDYLAWQLVLASGATPTDKTCFPIHNTPPKKEASYRAKIKGMKPGAKSLIDTFQPYNSGDLGLWKLHRLDIGDKHHLLFVGTYALNSIATPPINMSGDLSQVAFSFKSAPIGRRPDGTFPILKDGAEIVRFSGTTNVPENQEFDLGFEIAFADPKIVQGYPILPFLHHLASLVDGIASSFSSFL